MDMAAAKCPEPAWHTMATRVPIPTSLKEADHVFVRHGARRAPLTRPNDGPFRVLQRGEKFFTFKVGTKEQVVSVNRLKPAFGFTDPAPAVPDPRIKKTSTTAKAPTTKVSATRKLLNPAAEVFIPAKVVSRAGRTVKPPVRYGF